MNLSRKPENVKPTKDLVNNNIKINIAPISLKNMLGRIQGVSKGCSSCGR